MKIYAINYLLERAEDDWTENLSWTEIYKSLDEAEQAITKRIANWHADEQAHRAECYMDMLTYNLHTVDECDCNDQTGEWSVFGKHYWIDNPDSAYTASITAVVHEYNI